MEDQTVAAAGVIQNMSGKFEATFTNNSNAGEARYPYRSQQIQGYVASTPGYLDFDSRSGSNAINAVLTHDYRDIRIVFKSDLVSGTYLFPPDGDIKNVFYSEVQKIDSRFSIKTHTATKAELKLVVQDDRRRYSGTLDFEVLINGEILNIASSFDVVFHIANSSIEQHSPSTSCNSNASTSIAMLQNITGEFTADFFNDLEKKLIARAPYHSSRLSYDTHFLTPNINFYSQSGAATPSQTERTSDNRDFEIQLKPGTTSGTYSYPAPDSPVTLLRYSEMRWIDGGYMSWDLEILKAELELEVTDERHYVSKKFFIEAKTTTDAILYIDACFDIYLSRD